MQTFIDLPERLEKAISLCLAEDTEGTWVKKSVQLHERYVHRTVKDSAFVSDYGDALAYLALRVPSTYAEIFGALLAIREVLPTWKPESVLDIGSGPGTGIWAASELWPTITSAVATDENNYFIKLAKKIRHTAELPVEVTYIQQDITNVIDEKSATTYDLVILANVLNELTPLQREIVIANTSAKCNGVLVVIEPGTEYGVNIMEFNTKQLAETGTIIAPYVQNTFVSDEKYWIHFPQRFIRPDFLRRVRQNMRDNALMASDWEETKYCYAAVSKLSPEKVFWGRCVSQLTKQKGFLEVSILTADGIKHMKVFKRNKKQYTFARNLRWGQGIENEEDIVA